MQRQRGKAILNSHPSTVEMPEENLSQMLAFVFGNIDSIVCRGMEDGSGSSMTRYKINNTSAASPTTSCSCSSHSAPDSPGSSATSVSSDGMSPLPFSMDRHSCRPPFTRRDSDTVGQNGTSLTTLKGTSSLHDDLAQSPAHWTEIVIANQTNELLCPPRTNRLSPLVFPPAIRDLYLFRGET